VICASCQSVAGACACTTSPTHFTFRTSRAHIKGRFAIVTNVGRGMRWTRRHQKTNDVGADGEVVWFWRPDAGVKFMDEFMNDGGKKARSPGRARRKPLKPLARGMPGETGVTVVTMLVCSPYFCIRGCGRIERPVFPAPSSSRELRTKSGRDSRRGNAEACLLHENGRMLR
jgi:hypothetical protein